MRYQTLGRPHGVIPVGGVLRRRAPSATTLAVFDCFLAVGLLGLYLKFALLGDHWGAVARFLGKARPEDLTLADRLGFFTSDVVLNLLVIPIVGTVAMTLIFGAWRLGTAVVTSVVVSLWYFVELRAQDALGQYVSRDMLRDLAGWTLSNPGTALDYATPASIVKLAGLNAALFTILVIGRRARRAEAADDGARAERYRALLLVPAATVLAAAIVAAPICYAFRVQDSRLNRSSVGRAVALLAADSSDSPAADAGESLEAALAASSRLTSSSPFEHANPLVGRERDSDVIVFVMETGAARALDIASEGRHLPGTGPLFDRAFVAARHYTSHPYSSDALYSLVSGMYPQGRQRVIRRAGPGSLNGLMSAVADRVEVRSVYVPSHYQLELDDRMYAAFGADVVYASDEHDDAFRAVAERRASELVASIASSVPLDDRTRAVLRARLVGDYQAMEKMKTDITAAIRAGRRYSVIFFPEVGHGPWIPLTPDRSVLARGRALMLLQDAWLKEIVDEVRRAGRLENTIVALTGDHGIRTQAEDPALVAGTISDYMFRVPLLIYAPNTLSQTFFVSSPTSHIDVAPTLLGLLGATGPAARMQGVPVWQREPSHRIYFLAFAYGGADGFVENGTYYMRQALSGGISRSPDFAFDDDDRVGHGDATVPFVDGALEDLDALQRSIVARQVDSVPSGNQERRR